MTRFIISQHDEVSNLLHQKIANCASLRIEVRNSELKKIAEIAINKDNIIIYKEKFKKPKISKFYIERLGV